MGRVHPALLNLLPKEGVTLAVTGQQVYEMALALIDETTKEGTIDKTDLMIKAKIPSFLTTLQAELLPSTIVPVVITDITQALLLDDRVCLLVLPYGLAAHIIIQDNAGLASFFQQRYEELRSKKRAAITPIVDNYDVLSGLR